MALLIIFALASLIISFTCSIMEAVILSTTLSYAHSLHEGKNRKAADRLIKMKTNIDRPLSAILSLNTVANTIGAAGVGAQATIVFGNMYFGLVSGILTLLILFFSEIIPKTIGAQYWRKLALPAAKIISIMIVIAYPLVVISEFITKQISRKRQAQTVSREEFAIMTSQGTDAGIFEESESKVIHNLIRLKSIKVGSIMTPRPVMIVADENLTLKEFLEQKDLLQYSRIPVYAGTKDHINGYVLKYEVLEKLAQGKAYLRLSQISRKPIICYEHFPITRLFEHFIEQQEQIALIVNEYGDTEGVATMEDIIETLLGLEIFDEKDSDIDLQKLAREKWKIRAKKLNIMPLFDPDDPEL